MTPAVSTLQESYRHCRELARREAQNFYYGFVLLPPAQRAAIYAAYAFSRRCDDIVDDGAPSQERVERLRAYRQELDCCLAGQPQGPVFTALYDTIQRYHIPPGYFHQLIDGVEMDLTTRRYATFDDLRRYCYLVASVVGLITIHICGYRGGEAALQRAADLGLALQLTNILRDLGEDAARDRIYLPQDEMAAFGYSEAELLRGERSEAYYRLMSYQVQRGREYFRHGRGLLPLLPRRSRACVAALASIYRALLDRIEASDYDVFRRRVALSPREKLALAGRALVGSVLS